MSEETKGMPKVPSEMEAPKALNYIEKLVAKLCPDGVEYVIVGDIADIGTGSSDRKDAVPDGEYPFYVRSREVLRSASYLFDEESVIIPGEGGIGEIFHFVSGKYNLHQRAYRVSFQVDYINTKFAYYYFAANFKKFILAKSVNATVKSIRKPMVQSFQIPVPPLEVQNAIVEILDKFTKLEAELEAELAARRAQYEYYRKLLLEDITNRVSVERVELSEIFDISNGYTPKKSVSSYWDDGNVPWFRMEDIRRNGRVLSESLIKVHESAVKKSGLFPENSIIVATSATIGEHALIKIPFLCNQRFTALVLKEKYINKLDRKFLFYYCFVLDEWCRNNTTQSSFASVDMKGFRKFVFPVPSLTDQERIVSILDTFDALVNDISSGLPAELEARRKQYEYYRDRLLTFPRKFEPAEQAMQR